jgi:hypothetical protein
MHVGDADFIAVAGRSNGYERVDHGTDVMSARGLTARS